jgi:hypothetical protein
LSACETRLFLVIASRGDRAAIIESEAIQGHIKELDCFVAFVKCFAIASGFLAMTEA